MATATLTMGSAPAMPAVPDQISTRRLIAFLAMVFGMFMAILDIQIVSASLAEIQAGLSASSDEIPWVQTAYLIAEVIMIPLSGFLSRHAVDARAVHDFGGGLHGGQRAGRHRHQHRPDDRLPRHPGLHRRRHDPERLRRRLHHLPAVAARHGFADDRPGGDTGANHRPDGRRLYQPCHVVALAVSHQRRARHSGDDRGVVADRLRQAQSRPVPQVRLVGPCRHGGLSRITGICARGRPQQ